MVQITTRTTWHCAAQVAPNVAAMVLLAALPLLGAVSALTASFGVLCLRTLSSPVRGNGHVYGLAVTECSAVSASAWRRIQLNQAERPDVKDEIPNNEWITDDIQVRCALPGRLCDLSLRAALVWPLGVLPRVSPGRRSRCCPGWPLHATLAWPLVLRLCRSSSFQVD